MKIITLLLAFFAVVQAKPAFKTPSPVLQVRGGASVGPIDSELAANVGSTALATFIGGSASKWVSGLTGGEAPAVSYIFLCLSLLKYHESWQGFN